MVHADQYIDFKFLRRELIYGRRKPYIILGKFKIALFPENKWKIHFYPPFSESPLNLLLYQFLNSLTRSINFLIFFSRKDLGFHSVPERKEASGEVPSVALWNQNCLEEWQSGWSRDKGRWYCGLSPTRVTDSPKVSLSGLVENAAQSGLPDFTWPPV